MAAGGDYNGDLKLVAHQIGELTAKIGNLNGRLETSVAVHNNRLREAEKQSALQEQSLMTICKKVEALDSDVKKISLVSKIMGGIAGGLAVIAAAIGISR